ncbi:hypothetical protein LP420_15840 [Massilia sp. B-10]|nr:hypothetical protein LP420_15840 [Massilia sp. B-10]
MFALDEEIALWEAELPALQASAPAPCPEPGLAPAPARPGPCPQSGARRQ